MVAPRNPCFVFYRDPENPYAPLPFATEPQATHPYSRGNLLKNAPYRHPQLPLYAIRTPTNPTTALRPTSAQHSRSEHGARIPRPQPQRRPPLQQVHPRSLRHQALNKSTQRLPPKEAQVLRDWLAEWPPSQPSTQNPRQPSYYQPHNGHDLHTIHLLCEPAHINLHAHVASAKYVPLTYYGTDEEAPEGVLAQNAQREREVVAEVRRAMDTMQLGNDALVMEVAAKVRRKVQWGVGGADEVMEDRKGLVTQVWGVSRWGEGGRKQR